MSSITTLMRRIVGRDFFNWSIWAAGAFDYAADKVGLTYGAVAELNQKDWALRAGYFLIGDKPNSNDFDPQVFRRGGYVTEFEYRYALWSQPGKLRLIAWLNQAFSGSFSDAVNISNTTGIDPTTKRSNKPERAALNMVMSSIWSSR